MKLKIIICSLLSLPFFGSETGQTVSKLDENVQEILVEMEKRKLLLSTLVLQRPMTPVIPKEFIPVKWSDVPEWRRCHYYSNDHKTWYAKAHVHFDKYLADEQRDEIERLREQEYFANTRRYRVEMEVYEILMPQYQKKLKEVLNGFYDVKPTDSQ